MATDLAEVEVLRCAVDLDLPPGMVVDGCWALVCRLRAKRALRRLQIGMEWCVGHSWTEGGPESGEGLDAQTWSNRITKVSIGTEDAEFLASRARRGEWMPRRLDKELSEDFAPVRYAETGLILAIPTLGPDELCQFHFVIAWARDAPDDESTWYAVDVSPERLIRGSEQFGRTGILG